MNRASLVSPVAALLVSCTALAQTTSVTLQESSRTPVGGAPGTGLIVNQIRCIDKNIYFRQAFGASISGAPVIRLSLDGKSSHVFELTGSTSPEWKTLNIADFAVSGTALFLLGKTAANKSYLIPFRTNGERKDPILIDDSNAPARSIAGVLYPSKLAMMPGGEFLILGQRIQSPDQNQLSPKYRYTLTAELYSPDGRYAASLHTSVFGLNADSSSQNGAGNSAPIDLALTATGPDGIYLGIQTGPLTIYRVSAAAELERRFALEPPAKTRATNLGITNGQLFVNWETTGQHLAQPVYSLYSLFDGNQLVSYQPGATVSGALGCYDGQSSFTLLSSDGMGQRILKIVTP